METKSNELGMPTWWHHHGMKTSLLGKSIEGITIGNRVAGLKITKDDPDRYNLDWEIVFFAKEKVHGNVVFTKEHLRRAFGLEDGYHESSKWLIDKYFGDTASQGRFIRSKMFLNIPCPGTGHDGDPNISIFIDKEMQNSINEIIE